MIASCTRINSSRMILSKSAQLNENTQLPSSSCTRNRCRTSAGYNGVVCSVFKEAKTQSCRSLVYPCKQRSARSNHGRILLTDKTSLVQASSGIASTFEDPDSSSDKNASDPTTTDGDSETDEDEKTSTEKQGSTEEPEVKKPNSVLVRIASGLFLGVICAAVTFGGTWSFAIFLAFTSFQCVAEYYTMITAKPMRKDMKAPPLPLRNTSGLLAICIIIGTQMGIRNGIFEVATFALLSSLVVLRAEKKRVRFSQITSLVFGLFYCGYLPSFWVRLRSIPFLVDLNVHPILAPYLPSQVPAGLVCAVLPVLCIVASDCFAYAGGKMFGRTPLIAISPNKTVEGVCWGFAGATFTAVACNYLIGWPGPQYYWLSACLGATILLSSVFGDLLESSIKREAQMKDSGDMIPGHGGLLDRFDSYIFTGVVVYCSVYWFFWSQGLPLSQLTLF
mmetsp:Transcript_35636/g.42923  ORF Transcript_35636/g.42923 Transcript_35636/m.42923 type:complete len:448 (+) Transcript_35636:467-1810(+)